MWLVCVLLNYGSDSPLHLLGSSWTLHWMPSRHVGTDVTCLCAASPFIGLAARFPHSPCWTAGENCTELLLTRWGNKWGLSPFWWLSSNYNVNDAWLILLLHQRVSLASDSLFSPSSSTYEAIAFTDFQRSQWNSLQFLAWLCFLISCTLCKTSQLVSFEVFPPWWQTFPTSGCAPWANFTVE